VDEIARIKARRATEIGVRALGRVDMDAEA
jgi:hypothetical protein